jgi:hypothetical protein
MARLFISHSSRNNDKAIEIRDWLTKNGWDDVLAICPAEIFFAPRKTPPQLDHYRPRRSRTRLTCIGDHRPPIGAAMPRALRSAAIALLDVWPASMQRSMCRRCAVPSL